MRVDAIQTDRIPLSQWKPERNSDPVMETERIYRDHPIVVVGREDGVELWNRLDLSPIGAELFSEEGPTKYNNLRPILEYGATTLLQPAGEKGTKGITLPGYVELEDKESLSEVVVELGKQKMKIPERPYVSVPSSDIGERADRNWKIMYESLVEVSEVPREAIKSAGILGMLHQEDEVGVNIGILGRVLEKVHERRLAHLDERFGDETSSLRREFEKRWEGVDSAGDPYQLITSEQARTVTAGLLMVSLPTPAELQDKPAIHQEIASDVQEVLNENPIVELPEFAAENFGSARQTVSLAKQGLAIEIGEKLLKDTDLALDLIAAFEEIDKVIPVPDTKDPRQIETAKELLGIDADIQEGMSEIVSMQIEKHLEAGGSQVDALVMMAAGYKNIIHTAEGWVHLYGGDQQKSMTSEEVLENITASSLVKKLYQSYIELDWVDPNPANSGSSDEVTPQSPESSEVGKIEGLIPDKNNFMASGSSTLDEDILYMREDVSQEEILSFEEAIAKAIEQSPYKDDIKAKDGQLEIFATKLIDSSGDGQLFIGLYDIDASGEIVPMVIHTKSGKSVEVPFFFFSESKDYLFAPPGEGDPTETGTLLPVRYWEENGKNYFGFGFEAENENGEFVFKSTFALIELDPQTEIVTYYDPYSGEAFSWKAGNPPVEFFRKVNAKAISPDFLPTQTPPPVKSTPTEEAVETAEELKINIESLTCMSEEDCANGTLEIGPGAQGFYRSTIESILKGGLVTRPEGFSITKEIDVFTENTAFVEFIRNNFGVEPSDSDAFMKALREADYNIPAGLPIPLRMPESGEFVEVQEAPAFKVDTFGVEFLWGDNYTKKRYDPERPKDPELKNTDIFMGKIMQKGEGYVWGIRFKEFPDGATRMVLTVATNNNMPWDEVGVTPDSPEAAAHWEQWLKFIPFLFENAGHQIESFVGGRGLAVRVLLNHSDNPQSPVIWWEGDYNRLEPSDDSIVIPSR